MDDLTKTRLKEEIISYYRPIINFEPEPNWTWENGTLIERKRFLNAKDFLDILTGGPTPSNCTFDPLLRDKGYKHLVVTGRGLEINAYYVLYG